MKTGNPSGSPFQTEDKVTLKGGFVFLHIGYCSEDENQEPNNHIEPTLDCVGATLRGRPPQSNAVKSNLIIAWRLTCKQVAGSPLHR